MFVKFLVAMGVLGHSFDSKFKNEVLSKTIRRQRTRAAVAKAVHVRRKVMMIDITKYVNSLHVRRAIAAMSQGSLLGDFNARCHLIG